MLEILSRRAAVAAPPILLLLVLSPLSPAADPAPSAKVTEVLGSAEATAYMKVTAVFTNPSPRPCAIPSYTLVWSGQYEAMQRVRERLKIVLPLTLFLILLLLYANTKSAAKTAIIVLAVPFSAVGAIWFLYALGYNVSIGVWVGLIALMGVDAETGVFMLLYLDLAYEKASREGRLRTLADLQVAIVEGAAKRLRPKFMTVATMFVGLIPIMWATGTGSDVWKRIAAPIRCPRAPAPLSAFSESR